MNSTTSLTKKIKNAKELDFGTIFSAAIELFKKTWIQGFLLQVFTFIVMLPLILILYVPLITMAINQTERGYGSSNLYGDFFTGMSILYVIFLFIGIIVLGAVSVALNAAFYRIMKQLDHNEQVTTSDFFYFLKAKYLRKTSMIMVVSVLIAVPSALMCYIPLLYVMIPMSFFAIVFAFNPELSVGDIVKVSFNLGNKKWLIAFGLMVVASLLSQIVGLLLCGIGLLFTSAFVYHPTYLIYKNVIGFNGNAEIDSIGGDLKE